MSDQFVGEIRIFAGNYAPQGWHFCDGTLLTIAQYNTLYAVLGMTYGGDGINNFALPDLRSRVPIHQGTGPGLTTRVIGAKLGTERETLNNPAQLPVHTHIMNASSAAATALTVQGNILATTPAVDLFYVAAQSDPSLTVNLKSGVIGNNGGNQPHDNIMPYQALNYIIALDGYFPQRQ